MLLITHIQEPTDPASAKILTVTAVTTNTFSVDVGTSSDNSTHTFVSGVANAIKKINTTFNVVNAVYNGGTTNNDNSWSTKFTMQVIYF